MNAITKTAKTKMMVLCGAMMIAAMPGCKDDDTDKEPTPQICPVTPIELGNQLKSVHIASNNFAINFFDTVCKNSEGNVLVSPYSMQIALSMTANGAVGQTKDEMLKALGYEGLSLEAMNEYNQTIIGVLATMDPQTTVSLANSLWSIPGLNFTDEYSATCRKSYDADTYEVTFTDGTGQQKVSQWAESKTNGMIKEAGKGIDTNTRAAIVNATYFAGKWTTKFDPKKTADESFHNADGSVSTVKMMSESEVKAIMKIADNYAVIGLPYGNGTFRMDLLLPNENVELGKVAMDANTWNMDTEDAYDTDVNICLPRFEMEMNKTYNNMLEAMGIKMAFTPDADFTTMSPGDLFISKVTQKVKVKVDEEGTQAAAVTISEMVEKATYSYEFNRPFAFLIREVSTNTVLFAGKVEKL